MASELIRHRTERGAGHRHYGADASGRERVDSNPAQARICLCGSGARRRCGAGVGVAPAPGIQAALTDLVKAPTRRHRWRATPHRALPALRGSPPGRSPVSAR
jgi:hypothetical protein